jgi:ketosteroid isomerase-like protein
MKSLEERVQALEDAREIMNLKARYLGAADGGWDRLSHDADAIADCLTEDVHWSSPEIGTFTREGVRELMRGYRRDMPFAIHILSNPVLEVDGDTAKGRWHLQWQGTDKDGNELWLAGVYDDTFVRTDKGWKIKTLNMKCAYIGPAAKGWAKLMQDYLVTA